MKTTKEEVRLVVYTATHRVEGTYFKVPESRLLDDLNGRAARDFIPMRNVRISNLDGTGPSESWDFAALNRHQVVFVHTPESA